MSGITDVAEGSALKLIDKLKKAAGVLRDEDLPYALAGGAAAYARGAMPPTHDVDFVIREADADAAQRAFRARGMRVEIPPEGWLIKAYDDGRMIPGAGTHQPPQADTRPGVRPWLLQGTALTRAPAVGRRVRG
jgi:hypothetical protein